MTIATQRLFAMAVVIVAVLYLSWRTWRRWRVAAGADRSPECGPDCGCD